MISGIINVLKPAGMTSNGVLTQIKKTLHPNKIGHLGTLDPSATGVLPVCINKATKLFDLYLKKEKVYRTIFVFGKETTTLDSDGEVTNQNDVVVQEADLIDVLKTFVGKQLQMPPKYSAKKINGKNAYDLARQNVDFELAPKEIEVFEINLIAKLSANKFLIEIKCSAGTYIRSLARDIAQKLGTYGYMGALIRLRSGNFDIRDSVTIDKLTEQSIIPLKNVLKDRKKIFISDKFYDKINNGCSVKVDDGDEHNVIVFCKNILFGLGNIENGTLKLSVNLKEKND